MKGLSLGVVASGFVRLVAAAACFILVQAGAMLLVQGGGTGAEALVLTATCIAGAAAGGIAGLGRGGVAIAVVSIGSMWLFVGAAARVTALPYFWLSVAISLASGIAAAILVRRARTSPTVAT